MPRKIREGTGSESTRVDALSDGVFAVVITILVLELRLPPFEPGRALDALLHEWTTFVAFLVSFLYVGIVWMNHHALFMRVHYVDRTLLSLNLAILLTSALLPFPTHVLAEAFRSGNQWDQSVAVAFYAGVAGLMSAAWVPIFPYLRDHPRLVDPEVPSAYFHAQRLRPWTGVALYAASGLLGFVHPAIGVLLFVVMVVFHAVTSEGVKADVSKSSDTSAR
jgi:uncharacterized membrane protein